MGVLVNRKGGFVLILFVMVVAGSTATLLASFAVYVNPLLDIVEEKNRYQYTQANLITCKEIFLRNLSANFYFDEALVDGDIFFENDTVECMFNESKDMSISEVLLYYPQSERYRIVSQYPQTTLNARYRFIKIQAHSARSGAGTLYMLVYSNIFSMQNIAVFTFTG